MAWAKLPGGVLAALDGRDLPAKVGLTFPVVAADADGWPRMAILSAGEALAAEAHQIRLALYATSATARALRRRGRGLLLVVGDGGATKVSLAVREVREAIVGDRPHLLFACAVAAATSDRVSYATVTSGITCRLHDPGTVLGVWRAKLDALRAMSGGELDAS